MQFTLIDGMIPVAYFGLIFGFSASFFPHYPLVSSLVMNAAVPVYIALIPFVYRKFRLLPMLLPRCACCGKRPEGFYVLDNWPRITCRCWIGTTMGHGDRLFRRGDREKALIPAQAVTQVPETAALLISVFLESAEVRAEKLLIE